MEIVDGSQHSQPHADFLPQNKIYANEPIPGEIIAERVVKIYRLATSSPQTHAILPIRSMAARRRDFSFCIWIHKNVFPDKV